ncbi:SCO2400 family protein [Streptomyces purpurogeneiscleroticus]|uniref:SCO2400 family protein n=1 Tax=Streptomyces purpurogeneiscleroticus TaxID=68259 RepID=UPI001CC1BE24|nr:hypothetical protein [Streptomyces purpurogeneiscleroticus]
MDYCSSCRRHLNGALICPGCGDYAPDIAPSAQRSRDSAATAVAAAAAYDEEFSPWEPRSGRIRPETAAAAGTVSAQTANASDADPAGNEGQVAAAGQGRAARRRQLARWKKSRRRAAAVTALALVGGGLALGAMSNGSTKPHSDAAASSDTHRDTTKPNALESAPAEPGEHTSRHREPRRPAGAGSPREKTADATPSTAATSAPRHTPAATPSSPAPRTSAPAPRQTPATSSGTDAGSQDTTAPRTTTPTATPTTSAAPTDRSGDASATSPDNGGTTDTGTGTSTGDTGTTDPTPTPTAPSPLKVCLIGVCIG